jgi:hypothetical protein
MKKRCHTHQLDGEVNPQRLVYIFKTLFGGSLFVSLDVEAEWARGEHDDEHLRTGWG